MDFPDLPHSTAGLLRSAFQSFSTSKNQHLTQAWPKPRRRSVLYLDPVFNLRDCKWLRYKRMKTSNTYTIKPPTQLGDNGYISKKKEKEK